MPCSFVQRVQPGAGRVEIVDGGLYSFVLVRMNLNLKTETVEELLQKKNSMHITGFEVRVNELRRRLHEMAIAGYANARSRRDKDIQGVFWKKQLAVDGFIEDQLKKIEIVLKKHRARAAEDYSDGAVYRSLVAESLEAAAWRSQSCSCGLKIAATTHITWKNPSPIFWLRRCQSSSWRLLRHF